MVGLLAAAIAAFTAIYDASNIQREISDSEPPGGRQRGLGLVALVCRIG
jgi:hypothetical protein